ncbi:MAG: hypothetical protein ABWZ76_11465 [Acidimicrobiales bacterium]
MIVIGLCCVLAGGVIIQAVTKARRESGEVIDLRERLDPHVRGLDERARAVTAIRNRREQPPE